MKNTNWKPFMMFGVMIVVLLFIGLGFLAMMFSGGGDVDPGVTYRGWGPGGWGLGPFMMIFPCLGLIVMVFMAFFFFRMMTGEGGPMSGMMGRGGPMSGMMGHSHDPQSRSRVSQDEPQGTCLSCESPVQADWKVCPHCGQELV